MSDQIKATNIETGLSAGSEDAPRRFDYMVANEMRNFKKRKTKKGFLDFLGSAKERKEMESDLAIGDLTGRLIERVGPERTNKILDKAFPYKLSSALDATNIREAVPLSKATGKRGFLPTAISKAQGIAAKSTGKRGLLNTALNKAQGAVRSTKDTFSGGPVTPLPDVLKSTQPGFDANKKMKPDINMTKFPGGGVGTKLNDYMGLPNERKRQNTAVGQMREEFANLPKQETDTPDYDYNKVNSITLPNGKLIKVGLSSMDPFGYGAGNTSRKFSPPSYSESKKTKGPNINQSKDKYPAFQSPSDAYPQFFGGKQNGSPESVTGLPSVGTNFAANTTNPSGLDIMPKAPSPAEKSIKVENIAENSTYGKTPKDTQQKQTPPTEGTGVFNPGSIGDGLSKTINLNNRTGERPFGKNTTPPPQAPPNADKNKPPVKQDAAKSKFLAGYGTPDEPLSEGQKNELKKKNWSNIANQKFEPAQNKWNLEGFKPKNLGALTMAANPLLGGDLWNPQSKPTNPLVRSFKENFSDKLWNNMDDTLGWGTGAAVRITPQLFGGGIGAARGAVKIPGLLTRGSKVVGYGAAGAGAGVNAASRGVGAVVGGAKSVGSGVAAVGKQVGGHAKDLLQTIKANYQAGKAGGNVIAKGLKAELQALAQEMKANYQAGKGLPKINSIALPSGKSIEMEKDAWAPLIAAGLAFLGRRFLAKTLGGVATRAAGTALGIGRSMGLRRAAGKGFVNAVRRKGAKGMWRKGKKGKWMKARRTTIPASPFMTGAQNVGKWGKNLATGYGRQSAKGFKPNWASSPWVSGPAAYLGYDYLSGPDEKDSPEDYDYE